MEIITRNDLTLINSLSAREYSGNKILSNATQFEKNHLVTIKTKLNEIAKFYSTKYNDSYGIFETGVSTGNDIAIGGKNFKRIWSGMFKGASNKQYSAQISFVMNPNEACLNVGFYFGSASGHSKKKLEREFLENQLQQAGSNLSKTIDQNKLFREKYNSLFDFGFKTYVNELECKGEEWLNKIRKNAKSCQIFAKIFPNEFGDIENSTIDSYVAQIVFLMGGITTRNDLSVITIKPLSLEQRAKQAERNAEIGLKGEYFVFKKEKDKLLLLGINSTLFPRHVSLESDRYGYDILSLNENNEEIFIEVKTTTRTVEDKNSKEFFMTLNEYDVFVKNANKYILQRVYNIENNPSIEIVDLNKINKQPDGYICKY